MKTFSLGDRRTESPVFCVSPGKHWGAVTAASRLNFVHNLAATTRRGNAACFGAGCAAKLVRARPAAVPARRRTSRPISWCGWEPARAMERECGSQCHRNCIRAASAMPSDSPRDTGLREPQQLHQRPITGACAVEVSIRLRRVEVPEASLQTSPSDRLCQCSQRIKRDRVADVAAAEVLKELAASARRAIADDTPQPRGRCLKHLGNHGHRNNRRDGRRLVEHDAAARRDRRPHTPQLNGLLPGSHRVQVLRMDRDQQVAPQSASPARGFVPLDFSARSCGRVRERSRRAEVALRIWAPSAACAGAFKMEPGGIEPPCRDSLIVASTRVADVLISARRLPQQHPPLPSRRSFLTPPPGDASAGPACCFHPDA